MSANQRIRPNPPSQWSGSDDFGILNECVLFLVFESMKWDIQTLCSTASVNHKLRAVVKRLLWRELCVYSAPRMIATLTDDAPKCTRIGGGWHTLAKLMFFCCGCKPTRNFTVSQPTPGHFVKSSRFSKTSGRSFLTSQCRDDVLYVSDPCEHSMGENEDGLGIYRGVFKEFRRSRTMACLIGRQVKLEDKVTCPYCGAPVWSMMAARLVPKSAARRLGSRDGALEYFVCVNGHLHGTCWLVPLSSDDNEEEEMDGGDDIDGEDGVCRGNYNQTVTNGRMGSMGEEVLALG